MNVCGGCKKDFASVAAFDGHRVGSHALGEYKESFLDWTPKFGRRCLFPDELEDAGWELDARGRWVHPAALRNRPEKGCYSSVEASDVRNETRRAA